MNIQTRGDGCSGTEAGGFGKRSIPKVQGVDHWIMITFVLVIMVVMLTALEKKQKGLPDDP